MKFAHLVTARRTQSPRWARRPHTSIGPATLHLDVGIAGKLPATLMDKVMVVPAEPEHVVGARGAATGPEDNVMDLVYA